MATDLTTGQATGQANGQAPGGPRRPRRRPSQLRTRRRFARRQWARRWLTWRYVVGVVLALVLVLGGLYLVYLSPVLAVQGVQVDGTRTLSDDDVLEAAAVPQGGPLATADLDAIQRRVAALASVRSADVTRRWPHDVHITIVERDPVAVVAIGSDLRALDAQGVVFDHYRTAPPGLPRIDVDALAATDTDGLRQAAVVVAALPAPLARLTRDVHLVGADDIELDLTGGRTVRWGSSGDSATKAEVLQALLARAAKVYDVSVPGKPVVSG